MPFKSHPSQCPHSIFHKLICTFKFSSVVFWLSWIPNQNSCSIQRVLQGCPWQLALEGSWKEAWFPLLIISQYQLQTPCYSSAMLKLPFSLCLDIFTVHRLQCPSCRGSAPGAPFGVSVQELCGLPPWPELLSTLSLLQTSQEGALWSTAEKTPLQ